MTSFNSQNVLVVPRFVVSDLKWFVSWQSVNTDTLRIILESCHWTQRAIAERSPEIVQLIPCAVVRDSDGKYSVSRRNRYGREDIRSKLTLLYGGHVERMEEELEPAELLDLTLRRELDEEIGVSDPASIDTVGFINDVKDLASSRHLAVVFEVSVRGEVSIHANEEFSLRSKYCGEFMDSGRLAPLEHRLDPWSKLLFHYWISPDPSSELAMQQGFMLDTDSTRHETQVTRS